MIQQYILDETGNPVREPNRNKWEQWWRTANKVVQETTFQYKGYTITISTMFLGIPHFMKDFQGMALFETTVIAAQHLLDQLVDMAESDVTSLLGDHLGKKDIQRRYSTRDKALAGHQHISAFVDACLPQLTYPSQEQNNVDECN